MRKYWSGRITPKVGAGEQRRCGSFLLSLSYGMWKKGGYKGNIFVKVEGISVKVKRRRDGPERTKEWVFFFFFFTMGQVSRNNKEEI